MLMSMPASFHWLCSSWSTLMSSTPGVPSTVKRQRRLSGVLLVVGDLGLGLLEVEAPDSRSGRRACPTGCSATTARSACRRPRRSGRRPPGGRSRRPAPCGRGGCRAGWPCRRPRRRGVGQDDHVLGRPVLHDGVGAGRQSLAVAALVVRIMFTSPLARAAAREVSSGITLNSIESRCGRPCLPVGRVLLGLERAARLPAVEHERPGADRVGHALVGGVEHLRSHHVGGTGQERARERTPRLRRG